MAAKTLQFAVTNANITAQAQAPFKTARPQLGDRLSSPVKMMAATFDQDSREIRVFCEDGRTRRCKVDRLANIEVARTLWVVLTKAGKAGKPVVFVAAGGFSADTWFYTIK